ncbi:MAG: 50S ribosomal protein L34e [Candidatus Woesearchaeota archaeon]|nr:50S ribosomal protein L34e [Candidatus Woesearchaeota archaeon]
MTQPRFRARTFRRVFRKAPGGRILLHHEKRKNSGGKCAMCGASLNRAKTTAAAMKKLPKTAKRAERPYSNLCPKCMREVLKEKARQVSK